MNRATIILSVLILLFALPCVGNAEVKLAGDGSGFLISSFVAIAPGSVFYETDKGRVTLVNAPSLVRTSGGRSEWLWKTSDGRTASIAFEPREKGYAMVLSASPSDGITGWGFAMEASRFEYFTGLMERTVDGDQSASWREGITEALNLRGQKVEMIVKPTTSVYAPFYLSGRGYGLAVNSTWPGLYDFCAESPDLVRVSFEGPSLSCRFYIDSDPAAIVRMHAMESGPPVMPPKWAFTHWRWRDDHAHRQTYYDGTEVKSPYNSQVVEDILMMDALGIPCGVYWLDRPWATGPEGYDDFTWDNSRFPNHNEMIKWLRGKDTRLLLWIAPWVMGNMHGEAREKGYNLPGQTGGTDRRTLVDYTNPEAVKWWQQGVKKVLDEGVAGFKLDRSEEIVPSDVNIRAHDGRRTRELRNDYPHLYLKATYDIAKQVHGDDFILMPRAAFTGSTRYGVFWGGDVTGSEWGLRASIVAAQRCAVMGYPFWGSDTGGYWGGLDREVTGRWIAFSAFCPIMEVGPTRNRAPWDMPSEPAYDAELIAIWRLYATLHTDLVDYTYRYAGEAHSTGMPVIRPLFMAFPGQRDSWQDWQTFLYGEDILISAIWRKGTTEHTLYLPGGEVWIDAWDKTKVYTGGRRITVDAPMHKLPIFVRKGSKVDLGDLNALYQDSLARAKNKPDLGELQKTIN